MGVAPSLSLRTSAHTNPLPPQAASAVKVKDVPSFLATRLTYTNLSTQTANWATNYKQHIDAGSFKPLRDMIVGTFCLAYVVAWPQEYKHYMHEQAVKHGQAAAH